MNNEQPNGPGDFPGENSATVEKLAAHCGFSLDAANTLLRSLTAGGGTMAQFSHPELGGTGQWTRGGMIMIGDMFNNGLKARVSALCSDLAAADLAVPPAAEQQFRRANDWWPEGLGTPSATGAQNDMRYACFPDQRRLAVMQDGRVRVYDTGEHRIGGFSQQQGGGQTLTFSSQLGMIRLDQLKEV
jgi:hypothetical protein